MLSGNARGLCFAGVTIFFVKTILEAWVPRGDHASVASDPRLNRFRPAPLLDCGPINNYCEKNSLNAMPPRTVENRCLAAEGGWFPSRLSQAKEKLTHGRVLIFRPDPMLMSCLCLGSFRGCLKLTVAALVLFTVPAIADTTSNDLAKGAQDYKPFVVEKIGAALAGANELQAAVTKGDTKAAQAAWIKSRRGWEAAEPITGEFFSKLDAAIDAWPDAKHGYHAIEAPLFAGKIDEIAKPTDELVANLTDFNTQLNAANFQFTPQGLLNGVAGLAYEVGENKSKGGESPYAGTSLIDMQENVEGIEAAYNLALQNALKQKDPMLASQISKKLEAVEDLVKKADLKSLDQAALRKNAEEFAVLMKDSAPKLGLDEPKLGD